MKMFGKIDCLESFKGVLLHYKLVKRLKENTLSHLDLTLFSHWCVFPQYTARGTCPDNVHLALLAWEDFAWYLVFVNSK